MLDGQSGKVCIRYQIAANARAEQRARKHGGVTLGGIQQARAGVMQPGIDDTQCLVDRQRPRKDPAARGQAQEAQQRRPAKPDTGRPRERGLDPCACGVVSISLAVYT